MSLVYRRRRKLGRRTWLNAGTGGVSASHQLGKRVTVNTRGRGSVRLARGLSFRFRLW